MAILLPLILLASSEIRTCDQIRGTEYLSYEERDFYLSTCLHRSDLSVLTSIRWCESRDNYQAVSPGGKYRGAYQFDLQAWHSVGGEGDPIDASREEQDMRAKMLYQERGVAPWQGCVGV